MSIKEGLSNKFLDHQKGVGAIRRPATTRWTMILPSKVNVPYAINVRALCGAKLVTQRPGIQPQRNPCTPPSGSCGVAMAPILLSQPLMVKSHSPGKAVVNLGTPPCGQQAVLSPPLGYRGTSLIRNGCGVYLPHRPQATGVPRS